MFWFVYNYGVEKRFGQRFYEEVMMCICCYVVGEAWYDVIMLNWIGINMGKHEKQAVIMPVLQGQSCYYSALNLSI